MELKSYRLPKPRRLPKPPRLSAFKARFAQRPGSGLTLKAFLPPSLAESEQEPAIKVWVTTPDDRARDSHRLANGQARFRDEPFQVGEVALMEPRDPDGPPEETFNCRCRKEEYLLSRLPAQYLPQIVGRLTPAQAKFLNRGTRVASASDPGFVERIKEKAGEELLRQLQAIEAKLNKGGVHNSLTIDEVQYNYLFGSGRDLNVSIEDPAKSVGVSRDGKKDEKSVLKTYIEPFRNMRGPFPFEIIDFSMDTGLVYGHVRFDFQGSIQVDAKDWMIEGNLSAPYSDEYNFEDKPFGVRSFPKEIATRVFGKTVGLLGNKYRIFFHGIKQIKEAGTWQ